MKKILLIGVPIILIGCGLYSIRTLTTSAPTSLPDKEISNTIPETKDNTPVVTSTPQSKPAPDPSAKKTLVTIYIPKDPAAYEKKVHNDYDGNYVEGLSTLTVADFIAEKVFATTSATYGIERASADAAAATVQTQTIIKTIYFSVQGDTVYVIVNIDVDGWAGVSYSRMKVRPIITQTLLQFPYIKHVIFGAETKELEQQATDEYYKK